MPERRRWFVGANQPAAPPLSAALAAQSLSAVAEQLQRQQAHQL